VIYELYLALFRKFGEQHWWPADSKEEIILGAILTQNTSWNNVEKAIKNLKAKNACSIEAISNISVEEIEILIKPSGFYRQKARRLKGICKFLIDNYGENFIEKMNGKETFKLRNELLGIKGIGKETSDSILLYVCEKPIFVIDAYTRRIYNAINKMNKMNENNAIDAFKMDYDELREIFEDGVKKYNDKSDKADKAKLVKIYNEYHALIVRFGKECKGKDYGEKIKMLLNTSE